MSSTYFKYLIFHTPIIYTLNYLIAEHDGIREQGGTFFQKS